MSTNDPLSKLLVSESQAVDRQELADLLAPYLSINKENGQLDFSKEFGALPNAEKILVILAGVKAKSLVLGEDDHIAPSEIIKMQIAPVGSIKGTLSALLDAKEIKSEGGKYSLPNYKIARVVARFEKLKNKK